MSQAQETFLNTLKKLSLKNKEGWAQFEKLGWESTKECYQYARLGPLMMRPFKTGGLFKGSRSRPSREHFIHFCGLTGKVLESNLPKGIYLVPFKEASLLYGSILLPMMKKRTLQEQDPYVCLNRAFSSTPYVLYISPRLVLEEPVEVKAFSNSLEETLSFPHWVVVAGKESQTTWLFEGQHEGELCWSHRLFDLHLEPNARLEFQVGGHMPAQQESIRAHLERNAHFKWSSAFFKEGFSRQDFHISLTGEQAEVDLQGLSLVTGTSQVHTHVLIEHKAENTYSNQKFKNVVSGKGRYSFEGKIHVHPKAQQTKAYQLCNSLILSNEGRAYAKPNLEIFADDVKASHGATVGQIDEEALFYLTSRGVPSNEARMLLIEGFLSEILEEMEITSLTKDRLRDVTQKFLD